MRRNPFLAAALEHADRGFWVFPLRPDSKIPAVSDWENRATTNKRQIYAWWADNSRKNIGVATGPSRLLVVDLDTARDTTPPPQWAAARGGEDVLRILATEAGQPYPGDTFTVTTPSGGRHLYFRMPTGTALRNTAGRLGWKVDTRGHGGYIVAAGSLRREGRYRITLDRGVAPLPAWLTDALTTASVRCEPAERRTYPPIRYLLQAILDREGAAVAAAQPGTRHTTLLSAACTLGRLIAGGELDDQDAHSGLLHAATRHIGIAGMTQHEIIDTITAGIRYGFQRPRRLTGSSGPKPAAPEGGVTPGLAPVAGSAAERYWCPLVADALVEALDTAEATDA